MLNDLFHVTFTFYICLLNITKITGLLYGGGLGNTVENSGIFSLIWMC